MSEDMQDLCLLLVEDHYGPVCGKIFNALLAHGRSTLSSILQHTGLPLRQARHSLAFLIQHGVVLWSLPESVPPTAYEANLQAAYALCQAGKQITSVQELSGELASKLVRALLLDGFLRPEDLSQNLLAANQPQQGVLTNGHTSSDPDSTAKLPIARCLEQLEQDHRITPVHTSHFRSALDIQQAAESEMRRQPVFQGQLRSKDKEPLNVAIQARLRDWRDGIGSSSLQSAAPEQDKGKKRARIDDSVKDGSKRRRLADDEAVIVNGDHPAAPNDVTPSSDLDKHLTCDPYKLSVIARTDCLVRKVEETIGEGTAIVYRALLRLIDREIRACHDEQDPSPKILHDDEVNTRRACTTEMIVAAIDDVTFLVDSLGDVEDTELEEATEYHRKRRRKPDANDSGGAPNGVDKHHPKAPGVLTKSGHLGSDEEEEPIASRRKHKSDLRGSGRLDPDGEASEDEPIETADWTQDDLKTKTIRRHLFLLCEHPFHFVHRPIVQAMEAEKWSVDFAKLTRRLRFEEMCTLVGQQHGPLAMRVVRILEEKKKMDEKTLATVALMHPKQLRVLLAQMHAAGHLELQEVPRDTNRAPSRTAFFWFFDLDRCVRTALEQSYVAMARCLRRMRVERDRVRGVLDKAARTDVVGREHEFLSPLELADRAAWHGKEEQLLAEIARLDDLVCLLRDF